ncbi:MAG: ABC transporter ATP-binding protein [Planctomycetota bacterium]
MSASDLALRATELRHRHPGAAAALELGSFEIHQGAAWACIGPSGCGKTTLLHLLAGILEVQEGRVEALGADLSPGSPLARSEAARRAWRLRNIGLVFQELELLEHLTLEENVLLPWLAGGLGRIDATVRERARALLADVGLAAHLGRRPARLSQGERQRGAVCRALATDAPLLLADEPTGNLDPASAGHVVDLLLEASRRGGATLLVVTHDRTRLDRFDHVLDLSTVQGAGSVR